jgi:hypothetical protein
VLLFDLLFSLVWWFAIFAVVIVAILVGKTLIDYIGERVYGRTPERRRDDGR